MIVDGREQDEAADRSPLFAQPLFLDLLTAILYSPQPFPIDFHIYTLVLSPVICLRHSYLRFLAPPLRPFVL